jgi:uncharacterized protein (DUF1330 family)
MRVLRPTLEGTMPIHPTTEQINNLVNSDETGPVVMLNLLRFRPEGGRRSYASYGDGLRSMLEKAGARVLWRGRADSVVVGEDEADGWDAVILVEYPSRRAFLDMVGGSEYEKVGERRTKALVDSRLIACTEVFRAGA